MVILGMENLYFLTGFQWLFIFRLSRGMRALGVLVGYTKTYRSALIDFLVASLGSFIIIIICQIYLAP
tara:strand:- start:193 stop:396 length:204 start_codon:yes stop_codon:yes gene_type:complete